MTSAQHNYLLMRTALEQFGKPAAELDEKQLQLANDMAAKSVVLQQVVLNSELAISVQVPDTELADAMRQLRTRFDSDKAYRQALKANQLTEQGLKQALHDELKSEAVMTAVTKGVPEFSQQDAQSYYFENIEKFKQPERRYVRHILITVNPDFEENTEDQVKKRIQDIHNELTVEQFAWYAKRYSECPSAMNDGELGWAESGMLYPELDQKLFTMQAGELSQPIATEAGYHILYCQEIKAAHTIPFAEACEKIQASHNKRAKSKVQKTWLNTLLQPA